MLDIAHSTWRDHFARLDGAFAPSTLRAYYADVEHFETWCQSNAVLAFPVSVFDLCRYLEADGRCSSPATVRRRLYAVRKVHRLLRLPDPTLDEDINIALRKVKRAKLGRPKQAKGLTVEYLDQFIAVQPETPWGWRNRAMLSLGYDVLTRRSELVALQTSDAVLRRDGTLRVTVRRSKADPFGMGRVNVRLEVAIAELVEILRRHVVRASVRDAPVAVDPDLPRGGIDRRSPVKRKAHGQKPDAKHHDRERDLQYPSDQCHLVPLMAATIARARGRAARRIMMACAGDLPGMHLLP